MTDVIEKLNEDQERVCQHFRDIYFKLGWRTGDADREEAEAAVVELYRLAGKKAPTILWFDSPYAAMDVIEESTGQRQGLASADGHIDAYWSCYYRYGLWLVGNHAGDIGLPEMLDDPVAFSKSLDDLLADRKGPYDEKDAQVLRQIDRLVRSSGPVWSFGNYCLMTELPIKATYDANELLHNDNGPALLYRDGQGLYAVNGIRLPHSVGHLAIETPWKLTLEQINDPQLNEDVRTILQDRWCEEEIDGAGDRVDSGGGRYIKAMGAHVLDEDVYNAYTDENGDPVANMRSLLALEDEEQEDEDGDIQTVPGMRYLMCTDSSTDRVYYIPCGRDVNTCEEAHQRLNGGIPTGRIIASS